MKTKILFNTLLALGAGLAAALAPIIAHAQNLYVGTAGDEAIFEYTPSGAQSFFFSVASPPMSHHVGGRPRGLAFDSNGNLFLAFFTEEQLAAVPFFPFTTVVSRVLKFNPSNQVTTIGNVANFLFQGLAVDSAGNVFVMADDFLEKDFGPNGEVPPSTIFKFTPKGDRIVFGSVPGQGIGLAFDSAGNLYAASDDFLGDSNDQTIFKFAPNGTRTVFVGPSAFAAGLYPIGLAFDSSGNLFVSTTTFGNPGTDAIYKFTSTGGGGSIFASGLTNARGLAFDASGNLFVTEASPFPDGDILKFAPGGGKPTVFASSLRRPQFLTFGPPR